jgi:hypothetical protein
MKIFLRKRIKSFDSIIFCQKVWKSKNFLVYIFYISIFLTLFCKPNLERSKLPLLSTLLNNNSKTINTSASASSNNTFAISYPNSPYKLTVNSSITTISPTITGNFVSFSIDQALPAGLNFSTITGQISGTPTTITSNSIYTVSATYTTGISTASFDLSVVDIPPTSLTYTGSPYSFPDFVTITTITPTITGTVTSCNSSPTLPTGLTLSNSCAISGMPTVVQSNSSYTITASNSGGSTSTNIDITVTTFANKRIFVTSAGYLPGVHFNSPATADTLCNSDAGKPPGGGLFKAMVAGIGRTACLLPFCPGGGTEHTNWIFLPNTTYYQVDGVTVVATTNANGLMPATFVNQATPNAKYWTGLNTDWTTSAFNCTNWNGVGNSSCGGQNPNTSVNNFTDIWGGVTCGAAQQLLCIQQ